MTHEKIQSLLIVLHHFMLKIPSKYRKYIRPFLGIFILLLGLVFMFVPFIPLGYIFLAAALIILSYELPPVRRLLNRLKRNGNGDEIEKIEAEVDEVEDEISKKIVENESTRYQKKGPEQ
ncbi:hypothetical protein L21SP5_03298 [Salinivirga cyanobacteriivorans]|uniref:Transmembrane protein (PGPGW) n=1 Tax=Salinivirga cyanobacteriivorans TaxID=1307839 RepID=A0A0S2I3K3_9BACT|nr:PGPGW domain-containing protein [Salinivirga cyanobacteriivorans]ALO16911.1 hypothetical protein L21SP5_03298 [Salinivirga cyanobacteriivorans]